MEEREDQILSKAVDVFLKYGIKSVNMDDMSRHLGISKKTLYKYVKDKHDLVERALNFHSKREDCLIKEICNKDENAIDQAFAIMEMVMDMLSNVHPSIIFDMEKYHPGVFGRMMAEKQTSIYECMSQNMKRGKKQGLYRSDLNEDMVARIYIAATRGIFDPMLFPGNTADYKAIYNELFRYHIRGIAGDKGREYLAEKVKSIKKSQPK